MLSRFPIIRLLAPFAIGIVVGDIISRDASLWLALVFMSVAIGSYALMSWLSRASYQRKYALRAYFVVPIALMGVSLGLLDFILSTSHVQYNLRELNSQSMITGRIDELEQRDNSMVLEVSMFHCYSRDRQEKTLCGKLLVSTKGCNYNLAPGDMVAFPAHLEAVHNLGNPYEPDYAGWLNRRGIYYTSHVSINNVVKFATRHTLSTHMAKLRGQLCGVILATQLNSRSKDLIVALILGNKKLIDIESRQQFSQAGVAHVLALSGLHVAIIVALCWWFLFPLDYIGLKKMRLIITLLFLTFFAIFTGLSPSVVRASVMIGFVFCSLIFYRKSTPFNSLLAAALFILIASPLSLFDVGFQLSFLTVGALLVVAPYCQNQGGDNSLWHSFKALIATSIVAMVATIFITAHYFHNISLVSVISNVLILPIFPLFMLLGSIVVALSAWGGEIDVINMATDFISNYLYGVIHAISNWPFSHVRVYLSGFDTCLIYAIMALLLFAFFKKSMRATWSAMFFAIVLLFSQYSAITSLPVRGAIVLNSFSGTPIVSYASGECRVWCPDNENFDVESFSRHYSGFLARHHLSTVASVGAQGFEKPHEFIKAPFAYLNQKKLVVIGRGNFKKIKFSRRISVDYAIVTKSFHGDMSDVVKLYEAQVYVLSGSIYNTDRLRFIKSCQALKLNYFDMSHQGAFLLGD